LAAQLDAEGKVRYGVTQMPTNVGKPVTLGVEDYLMAFKKKDNREAEKGFLDLYYQPEQITRWIAAEGFLPVTTSGLAKMGDNPKLKPYLDALPKARLPPPTGPTPARRAAERAARADDRPHLGSREGRRPAENRPRSPARRRPQAGPGAPAEERP